MNFKVGDHVYARGWYKGYITKIYPEDKEAVVEFETGNGGGCLPFAFEELEHVPKVNIKHTFNMLCDKMLALWKGFQEEIQKIPEENDADLVLKWHDYFEGHVDSVCFLNEVQQNIEEAEQHLIMQRILKYKD